MERDLPPLVQVLPFSNKTSPLHPKKVESFKDGLLAWGNMDTAIEFGHLFHVVIVTAEEFPFTDKKFMQSVVSLRSVKVYHVPISEVNKGSVVREENLIDQPVIQVSMGLEPGTILRTHVILRKGAKETKSDELIYVNLLAKRRVLVVCMAGKNRSTATIIRFLLLQSARQENKKETELLLHARHPTWYKQDWENWLRRKRKFLIFALNDVQLETLDNTLASLKLPSAKKSLT